MSLLGISIPYYVDFLCMHLYYFIFNSKSYIYCVKQFYSSNFISQINCYSIILIYVGRNIHFSLLTDCKYWLHIDSTVLVAFMFNVFTIIYINWKHCYFCCWPLIFQHYITEPEYSSLHLFVYIFLAMVIHCQSTWNIHIHSD